jgi:hypothetical protein
MKISRVGLVAGLLLAALLLSARPASADAVFYYRGPHAVPTAYGGFCHIGVRHFHTYKPEDTKVFRYDDNTYIFIGDPTAHGWEGPRVSYYGHHPIASGWGGGWCFIGGPHYHFYNTFGSSWSWHGGAYYWAGPWTDPWYLRYRGVYGPIFANYYVGRVGYMRPVVYAGPPRFYGGPRVTVPVAAWRGPTMRVNVAGPRGGMGGRPGMGVGGRPGMGVGGRPGMGVGGHPGMSGAPGMHKTAGMPGGMKQGGMPGGMKQGGMSGGMKQGGIPSHTGPGRVASPGGSKIAPGAGRGAGMTPRTPATAGPRTTPGGRSPGMSPGGMGRGPSPAARPAPAPRPSMPAARPAPAPRPSMPAPSRGGGGGGGRRP